MKKVLLQGDMPRFKANLHCHTTISDGRLSPEQVKEVYLRHGYSVVAFTDHDVMIPHPELCDDNFLALTGYEMEIVEPKEDGAAAKCCHLCLVALSPKQTRQVCWHREKYLFGNAKAWAEKVDFDRTQLDYVRAYTPACVNDMIQKGRENGFFVTYNHPCWSREDYQDYCAYHGMNAMEMINYGCEIEGYDEYNGRVYDDMLRGGERLFCIAADDNHNVRPESDPQWDSCGGYTVILAQKLQYESITQALQQGDFYASEGPQIDSLVLEDGTVHLQCSPCVRIACIYGTRHGEMAVAKPQQTITQAQFAVKPGQQWFRLEVQDAMGKKAYTNAYFL